MSSRMERYSNYNGTDSVSRRSDKNRSIYDQIQDLDTYTNIEAVASIENNNEIDITKVKNMIQNRENYKQQKQFGNTVKTEYIEEYPQASQYEEKNYDINEALSRIKKDDRPRDSHKLTEEQYEFLKNLKRRDEEFKEDEEEIKDLLNTIASNKKIIGDDVGLFDNLKSDTMVGDASSIKKIIDEEKHESRPSYDEESEIDKSFYTSSFGFTRSDFEELKTMNHNIKRSNKTIILLLITLIAIVILCVSVILVK